MLVLILVGNVCHVHRVNILSMALQIDAIHVLVNVSLAIMLQHANPELVCIIPKSSLIILSNALMFVATKSSSTVHAIYGKEMSVMAALRIVKCRKILYVSFTIAKIIYQFQTKTIRSHYSNILTFFLKKVHNITTRYVRIMDQFK